jgi:hypothetical protein
MREPLVHFLLIGAGLFLMFSFMNGSAGEKPNRIGVSPGQVEQLEANFSCTWMRQPTEDEIAVLVRQYVRDEVCCREALSMLIGPSRLHCANQRVKNTALFQCVGV